jgi:hypothetical protein
MLAPSLIAIGSTLHKVVVGGSLLGAGLVSRPRAQLGVGPLMRRSVARLGPPLPQVAPCATAQVPGPSSSACLAIAGA